MLQSHLTRLSLNINNCLINYQCVRWRRKPRWLPVAKSKMFKVPERPNVPLEEKLELQRLHNNYHTQVRAIRKYLIAEVGRESIGENRFHMTPEEELEDFAQCMKINDEWNKKVAEIRNKRLENEALKKKQLINEDIEQKNALKLQRLMEVEEKVLKLKEESKTFITKHNIDAAIEAALTQVVDYNFSIDTKGNINKGRITKNESEQSNT
ncbi:probable 28S ribosomal protein S26, mitochondrial [Ctenocephalides felis]|uniref:probable 28S ribosomal protein S26, mitochondrial n=1 Tax=Ctenocephalides felis TaxID=7515 RepID=UPI000E6E41AF|nr:probable 28S ribosomal protein S26, mitochondrial [Ctenocephalides felis]